MNYCSNLECEVSGVVVQPAAEHQGQDVLDALRTEDPVVSDWTDAAVGQGRGDHALRLASHLQRTSLQKQVRKERAIDPTTRTRVTTISIFKPRSMERNKWYLGFLILSRSRSLSK